MLKIFNKAQLSQKPDEDLFAEYSKGNQQAFEILYSRHRDALYRFILRQCNNQTARSEEIFQEVWFSLIRNSSQFRADSKLSTYLYQIARNRIIDEARKSVTHNEAAHDAETELLEADENTQPDHKSQLMICIELLQQFVLQLPSEQREAFVLKQETEYSLEQLAHITQTTTETLKSRLRYAMKKLREWLPGDCL